MIGWNSSGFEEVESGVWSGPALIDPYAGVVDGGALEVGESVFVYEVGTASCAQLLTPLFGPCWNIQWLCSPRRGA